MKLYEFEGQNLFKKYGIPVPESVLISKTGQKINFDPPYMLKAQVLSGDRKKAGGIMSANSQSSAQKAIAALLKKEVNFEPVKKVLAAKKLNPLAEYYLSFSYDTGSQGPVFAVSPKGGSGIANADVFPIDIIFGLRPFVVREYLAKAGFISDDITKVADIAQKLWQLFLDENLVLSEINPLIKTKKKEFIAADSKIITKTRRRVEHLGGDIAILASGGGASVLSIDALIEAGGDPANYTEYSGNPSAELVMELTKEVLGQKNLKGCWVVGGTANFTDIFETLSGFVRGLRQIKPKPAYPIVIRRDGPRQKEAAEMLRAVAKKEGYNFHVFGSETSIASSARTIVDLSYKNKK
ncbi:MAG: hypothetical protein A2931_03710 [Candidatus Niyogibacteria bacterium RIFCSPLOWO2_01_FULL_45_48]|uniref:Uncharacterized protein n=2 Tax=Candidatus Niyogiibacteriota TaxID=1817912 RepID=A0A1G2EWL2_9BACT|nr:MAG: hypothetical protein A3J00_00785 [Candidatus Niyogibacteria bacterium RIFCSPLOWO2_02_FULL_45_13]OGZ30935.1 MAG: hypothetical protein A2931_03710 [Candidatus Niyogibacteria bacterium RIFCSPLOWO2_01_FULL_45_48]